MGDSEQGKRRQRHIAEKKEQILKAAEHLFAQKGFRATTLKDIAEDADLSEGTIYNYFDDKEHLFIALLDKLIDEQNRYGMYTKSLPTDTRSFLDSVFDMQHEFLNDHRELMQAVFSEVLINVGYREKFLNEFLTPAISFFILNFQVRGVLGQIRPVNHQTLSRSLVALLYGFYILQLLEDPIVNENWESLLGQTISLMYEGLSAGNVP
jgi:AcrR family transcriptional regulator